MVGHGDHAPDGYYILKATSGSYQLDEDVTEERLFDEDGCPMQLPEGSRVVDAVYLNEVPSLKQWFTPYGETPCGCACECECDRLKAGRVRVPSHMVMGTGFEMASAPAPTGAKAKKSKAWGVREQKQEAVAKGAVLLSHETHREIMDELEELVSTSG